jgi:hypothetical protein
VERVEREERQSESERREKGYVSSDIYTDRSIEL